MVGNQVTKIAPRRGPMQLDSMLAASRENEGEERAKPHHCLLSRRDIYQLPTNYKFFQVTSSNRPECIGIALNWEKVLCMREYCSSHGGYCNGFSRNIVGAHMAIAKQRTFLNDPTWLPHESMCNASLPPIIKQLTTRRSASDQTALHHQTFLSSQITKYNPSFHLRHLRNTTLMVTCCHLRILMSQI